MSFHIKLSRLGRAIIIQILYKCQYSNICLIRKYNENDLQMRPMLQLWRIEKLLMVMRRNKTERSKKKRREGIAGYRDDLQLNIEIIKRLRDKWTTRINVNIYIRSMSTTMEGPEFSILRSGKIVKYKQTQGSLELEQL